MLLLAWSYPEMIKVFLSFHSATVCLISTSWFWLWHQDLLKVKSKYTVTVNKIDNPTGPNRVNRRMIWLLLKMVERFPRSHQQEEKKPTLLGKLSYASSLLQSSRASADTNAQELIPQRNPGIRIFFKKSILGCLNLL